MKTAGLAVVASRLIAWGYYLVTSTTPGHADDAADSAVTVPAE